MAFADATNSWVARHLTNMVKIHGQHQSPTAHPSGSQSGFYTGMASPNYDDVVDHTFPLFTDTKFTKNLIENILCSDVTSDLTNMVKSCTQINRNQIKR